MVGSTRTRHFGKRNKTIDMLQEELVDLGSTVIVSGEYTKALIPVSCFCPACEYTWNSTPNNLLGLKGCPSCAGCAGYSLESLQKKLDHLNKNITIKGSFTNLSEKLQALCGRCGYEWQTTGRKVVLYGCSCCNKKVRWDLISFNDYLLRERPTIGLLSTTFINVKSNLIFCCKVCSYVWDASATNVLRGTGFSNCALTGYKFLRPANLYYTRVTTVEGKVYFKIGVSSKDTLKRYSAETKVKIEVLYQYRFETGKGAYLAEQNILQMFKDYLFKGNKIYQRTGNTEIFTHDILQLGHLEPMAVNNYAA